MTISDSLPANLFLFVVGLIGLAVSFLPSWIARRRSVRNLHWIVVTNLIAGVTVLGWVAVMIWALYVPAEIELRRVRPVHSGGTL